MWDERYTDKEYVYGKEPNDFLKDSIGFLPISGRILSLAEGEGRNGVFLANQGFDVQAIDSSIEGIKKAKRLAIENNVTFDYDQVKLEEFEFEKEPWDGIISIFAHTSKKIQIMLFEKIKKNLKSGGVFLLEGYNSKQLENSTGGPKSEDMMFDLEHLKSTFSDFEIIIARDINRVIHEGKYHNGSSEVIQFVCRKR